jgi:hypothetical protein
MINDRRGQQPRFETGSLHAVVAAVCGLTGALLLIAPHQFAGPIYAPLSPHLELWGGALLLAGVTLTGTAVLPVRRAAGLTLHLLCTAVMLAFAHVFTLGGGTIGPIFYSILGIATALVPLASRPSTARTAALRRPSGQFGASSPARDLLLVAVGCAAALIGALTLFAPGPLPYSGPELLRPLVVWCRVALLVGGVLLVAGA